MIFPRTSRYSGFTLIELLIVIAIIGILASTVLSSLNTAREKGKIAKAQSELRSARNAIAMLESDTGKWPNGCDPGGTGDPEVLLDAPQAGILTQPSAGTTGLQCAWTQAEVDAWKGPYMQTPKDPWGHSYIFDPDYHQYENCATTPASNKYPTVPEFNAILSPGPTMLNLDHLNDGINDYDCDDIFFKVD